MALNPNIILSGQQGNPLAAYSGGFRARATDDALQAEADKRNFLSEYGSALYAGDQNALAQYAGHDVQGAMGLRNSHEQRQMRIEAQKRARAAAARASQSRAEAQKLAQELEAARRAAASAEIAHKSGNFGAWAKQNGYERDIAPEQAIAAMYLEIGEYDKALSMVGEPERPMPLSPEGKRAFDAANGYEIPADEPDAATPMTQIAKLNADRDAGLITAEQHEALVAKATQANGLSIQTGPDGTLVSYGQQGPGFGKSANNDIDARTINSANMLSRLQQTSELFSPEFMTVQRRASDVWARGKDKLGVASGEEQAAIAEVAQFKSVSFDNLSQTLKEMSGAAVTPQEFERLKQSMPNPGTGVFDGDSPAEFQAKLEQSITMQKLAIARYNMWKAQGGVGSPWDMGGIDEMEAVIKRRGGEIATELREQGLTDATAIRQRAAAMLKQEMGL